jgi:hypothetical protein
MGWNRSLDSTSATAALDAAAGRAPGPRRPRRTRGLGAADRAKQAGVLVGEEDERLDAAQRPAEGGDAGQDDPGAGGRFADAVQERLAQLCAEATRRGVVRGVVRADHHRDDIGVRQEWLSSVDRSGSSARGSWAPDVGDRAPPPSRS